MLKAHYQKEFEKQRKINHAQTDRKNGLLDKLLNRDFPTKKLENWRYLDIDEITTSTFRMASKKESERPFKKPNFKANLLSFTNGYLDLERSEITPEDARCFTINSSPKITFSENEDAFQSLNELFTENVHLLTLHETATLHYPIYIMNLIAPDEQASMSHLNLKIELKQKAKGIIILHDISDDFSTHLHTQKNSTILEKEASLTFYHLQETAKNNFIFHFNEIFQKEKTDLTHFTLNLSNYLFRQSVTVTHEESEINTNLYGLIKTDKKAQADIEINILHRANDSRSFTKFNHIANDQSRITFQGIIEVEKGTKKNSASLLNHNIPLSKKSEINTKPVLKIYSDDVQCSHGATINYFDEEQLNFLRLRGLETELAKKIILHGTEEQILNLIEHAALRNYIEEKLV